MKYALNIDWLQLNCLREGVPSSPRIKFHRQPYGTRQFACLDYADLDGEPFAELQSHPHSGILKPNSVILKVLNRWLYSEDLFSLLWEFVGLCGLRVVGCTRLDIAADFNTFDGGYHPIHMISDFMTGQIRKKGKSQGCVFFRQRDSARNGKGYKVKFNAIKFGRPSSDVAVYLYNKTLELKEEKDKPWIRDVWEKVGLSTDEVWRLEVSLKGKALRFRDKETEEIWDFQHDLQVLSLNILFHTFRKKYFYFTYPDHDSNVTRQKEVQLFADEPCLEHVRLREVTGSDVVERRLIKQLHFAKDLYRGLNLNDQMELLAFADKFAEVCDLKLWYIKKQKEWDAPAKKQ